MIENTSSPASLDLTAMLLLATGDTTAVIEAQEKTGQTQLVHSDRLPAELGSPRNEFEALGFAFGDPDPRDPMFAPATLPAGWTKQGSDHDMWSYVVDQLGRRRVGVFYKAAFYDRKADMHIVGLSAYVSECVYEGRDIVTDEVWATRQAVAEAARGRAAQAQERVNDWTRIAERNGADATSAKYIAEYTAERDKYTALAARYTD
jgi:hypothetical protein